MNNVKHRKIFILLYFVLLVSWLTFIFSNSLSIGTESVMQSDKVVEITQKIVSTFDKDAVVKPSSVRTSAHFFEFFVLGIIYALGISFFNNKNFLHITFTLGASLFTALVDETIQMGVEGRGSQVTDVWVDFLGALTAHFVVIFFVLLYRLIKKKQI